MAKVDISLRRIFVRRKKFPTLRITYDKTSKSRPAWIKVDGLPKNTCFLALMINGKREIYRIWITSKYSLFLPIGATKIELEKFYNEFSRAYDKFIIKNNLTAAKFLVSKTKVPKTAKVLDLGAGTGIASEVFAKAGYKNITLVDFSAGMLAKARKKPALKGCRFIEANLKKLNLGEKFDLIISNYCLADEGYFDEGEMPAIWEMVARHMTSGAELSIMGYYYKPPSRFFKKLKSGTHLIRKNYRERYYIGVRR